MSLDALAPDQRAVVQLVLQQDRSYEELSTLLGIHADAVRERAHQGLERLAPAEGLDASERAGVADYLLGQQTVSGREATRALLSASEPARAWARALSDELRDVARGPLPGVPAAAEPDPAAAAAPDPAPQRPAAPGAEAADDAAPGDPGSEPAVRARPRPRRDPGDAGEDPADHEDVPGGRSRPVPPSRSPRSSRLGGALLIALGVIAAVAVVVLLVRNGNDDKGATKSAKATPTPTATARFQPLGQVPLRSPGGGRARGQMVVFASASGGIAFTIQGSNVPASGAGEAYAVWLTGGDAPHRLGFAPQVTSNGKLGTSGPRDQDASKFAGWFAKARQVVVSRETSDTGSEPGQVVLQGAIPQSSGGG